MNKVYCDVCGTAYSEKDTHCHNCGCARPAQEISAKEAQHENGTYTYVKGGRFSKANVRKRNQDKPRAEATQQVASQRMESLEDENKADRGLVIAVCVLLLAVVAVVIYIITRFFAPGTPENSGGNMLPETTNVPTVMTTVPGETTEEPIVPTTEEPVVTVPETQSETQPATEPTTESNNNYYVRPYKTNKEDQKNDASIPKGTSFQLKLIDATGEVMDVDWLVEDPDICSVEENTVTGLKRGNTKVYVVIDGETYYCIVRVK